MKNPVSFLTRFLLAVALSGCASIIGFPQKITYLSNAEVEKLSLDKLCQAKNLFPKKVRPALQKKGVFDKSELDLIMRRRIQLGMSEEGLLCSWGKPKDVNTSVGAWGVHKQYVYGLGLYVYIKKGKVTSWQD